MNMKLVIDIDEHIWNMVVNTGTFGCYRFNTSRAIRKGIPLEKIRDEIMDTGAYEQEINGKTDFLDGINYCLNVINKYMTEGENKEVNKG